MDTTEKNIDIGDRMEFMGLTDESSKLIQKLKPVVERELANGLDIFYAKLRQTPDAKKFFSSEDHI